MFSVRAADRPRQQRYHCRHGHDACCKFTMLRAFYIGGDLPSSILQMGCGWVIRMTQGVGPIPRLFEITPMQDV